jgi:hypothetical protein
MIENGQGVEPLDVTTAKERVSNQFNIRGLPAAGVSLPYSDSRAC